MSASRGHRRRLAVLIVVVLCVLTAAASAQTTTGDATTLDALAAPAAGDFSPSFLGMYRKLMEIDGDILRYAQKYGVDPRLARAVCMFESGVNPYVTSGAGAHGYFQVMPSTFRLMRVPTNIEAGIKYLSQLIRQFDREDYALAAYNGGPGRVARGRAMPLESLQYVLGVGYYRSVLNMYEPAVRAHASALALVSSHQGDTWEDLSARLHVPSVYLRLYNPFVTDARLRRDLFRIAYPAESQADLLSTADDGHLQYRSRIGDNYINLAFALGVDVDRLRDANGLWRLQVLPARMLLTIPAGSATVTADGRDTTLEVEPAADIQETPRVAQPPVRLAVARPSPRVHRVTRGETLGGLARRYDTTIRAIQRANNFGRRTTIRIGERLRIPE